MTDILQLFRIYKDASRTRFSLCEDNDSKVAALEAFVDELLDQNELLIETVQELQIVSRNRWEQLESRLINSANSTQESALHLQKYEQTLKAIVNECLSSVSNCDCDELNNRITALKIENSFLRDQNENLKHDLENVLKVVKLKKGANEGVGDCYDFCDSLSPEDVFGSIERIATAEKAMDVFAVNEVDCVVQGSSKNNNGEVVEGSQRSSNVNRSIQVDLESSSNQSEMLILEKQQLITELQEHIQNVSNEIESKNEVIKCLDTKLSNTRKENEELKTKFVNLETNLGSIVNDKHELEERILTLNEQKRSLMIQLDDESDLHNNCKEELKNCQRQITELKKRNELQSMTIQHLRDAITDQVKVLTSSRSNNVHQNSYNDISVGRSSQQDI